MALSSPTIEFEVDGEPVPGELLQPLTSVPRRPASPCGVAVIVPCYNVEYYLQRALDSAFAQSYRDHRIYAVDDGSTDRTAQVLQRNASRITFVSQPRGGAAKARNRAIQMSAEPFIAFLDADDEWLPQKLERQIALLKADPGLGLVCSSCFVGDGGNVSYPAFAHEIPGSGRLFCHLARNCFVFTPTVVVRRQCLDDVGLFNESLAVSEDFNLWLRIAARWKIAFVSEPLAITYKRPESLSSTISSEARLRTGVAALEDVTARCPELLGAEGRALRRALAERLYFYGSFLLSTGDIDRARRQLVSALRCAPTYWRTLAKLGLSLLPRPALASLLTAREGSLRHARGL